MRGYYNLTGTLYSYLTSKVKSRREYSMTARVLSLSMARYIRYTLHSTIGARGNYPIGNFMRR
jgi:hypothetical protein